MLICRQKTFQFCIPRLKTRQPVLPYWTTRNGKQKVVPCQINHVCCCRHCENIAVFTTLSSSSKICFDFWENQTTVIGQCTAGLLQPGGRGDACSPPVFGIFVNPIATGGQIMRTTLLLKCPPDLATALPVVYTRKLRSRAKHKLQSLTLFHPWPT